MYESLAVRFLEAKWRNVDIIVGFTYAELPEREGHGTHASLFKLGWKASISIFLCLFNESILKQQHAENTAKCAKIDVSELLKLQNVLRALNTVAVRKLVDLVYLFYLFIWHFIFRWCLQVANANKNQQNTIKILLISST